MYNATDDKWVIVGGGPVSDAAYSSAWDGITTKAPSKNAVYDALNDGYGDKIIQFTWIYGTNGFTVGFNYGPVWSVSVADVDAAVGGQTFVKKGGTFKIKIAFSCTGVPLNNKIRTSMHAYGLQDDEALSFNLINADTTDWLTGITTANDLYIREWGSTVTIGDNEQVGLHIAKTASDAGTGNIYIRAIWLERQ